MDKIKVAILLSKLKNNFQFWWVQFQLYATVKKFEESVDPDVPDPNLPESEAAKIAEGDIGEKQKRAKVKNSIAMASLTHLNEEVV